MPHGRHSSCHLLCINLSDLNATETDLLGVSVNYSWNHVLRSCASGTPRLPPVCKFFSVFAFISATKLPFK
ncbi:hypothetical protein XELAEV_18038332mg [Xenopus laevis]|uniref:Uncharacterized protein n=1 Tax=Xenopus laevis TaxID=8355 RepID=A0A974C5I8_XENLA|nr:hypothetical protein XELAEV_18038332mg [Xenopus laevis]